MHMLPSLHNAARIMRNLQTAVSFCNNCYQAIIKLLTFAQKYTK